MKKSSTLPLAMDLGRMAQHCFWPVTLSSALGACSVVDNTLYGNRQGTVEYPGSGASAGATAVYIVREKDTVDGVASRFGVSPQSIIERNKLKSPYQLRAGQQLDISGARLGAGQSSDTATAAAVSPTGPVKSQSLEPPSGSAKSEAPRSAAPAGEPTPLSPPATAACFWPPDWPVAGEHRALHRPFEAWRRARSCGGRGRLSGVGSPAGAAERGASLLAEPDGGSRDWLLTGPVGETAAAVAVSLDWPAPSRRRRCRAAGPP